jgi:hypothetical protein
MGILKGTGNAKRRQKVKKMFVVFLFFVSFNLFAQKQEIGRLTWEFRDYDRDWRWEVPEKYRKDKWKEVEVHFTSTIPNELLRGEMQVYIDRFSDYAHFFNKRNGYKLIFNYPTSLRGGRVAYLETWLNMTRSIEPDHPFFREIPYRWAQGFCVLLDHYNPEYDYYWEMGFNYNDEEEFWTVNKSKLDEDGVPHYKFAADYIIYREPR